jgi:ATP-dependent DNA ligase
MLRPPVLPMRATAVQRLPGPDAMRGGSRYEPKWDGWRAVVFVSESGVYVQSRSGKSLNPYFPDLTRIVRKAIQPGAVLDGELIVWDTEHGRTNFVALQHRLTAGRKLAGLPPAHFVAFDLLQAPRGDELLGMPLSERRRQLTQALTGAPPQLSLCPQTADVDEAREWFDAYALAGVEGLVIKGATTPYRPGVAGWRKLRHRSSTEAIVAGITGTFSAPETLVLGRFDGNGRLREVGRTGALTVAQRREVSGAIELANDHSVLPTLVVEVEVDPSLEGTRWRHAARFLRLRRDLSVYDVPLLIGEP